MLPECTHNGKSYALIVQVGQKDSTGYFIQNTLKAGKVNVSVETTKIFNPLSFLNLTYIVT